ncbi:hypothetical protein [Lyngbya confervoides]|uniref:Uncharacterized protein n=1 Tax=Lyngbya confervoides BDU141951 TaxID=1574623 RepID=A0ABD4T877_9CYAN|nr:hypothetical protein [Lyngbya confervoides]MCM1984933.1 hypothetical protein [Lyngbya confervoides BDU141951]
MNVKKQARERLTQDRKQEEHLHENMVSRAQSEPHEIEEETLAEQAREILAEKRLHEKQLEQSMLERAAEEVRPKD